MCVCVSVHYYYYHFFWFCCWNMSLASNPPPPPPPLPPTTTTTLHRKFPLYHSFCSCFFFIFLFECWSILLLLIFFYFFLFVLRLLSLPERRGRGLCGGGDGKYAGLFEWYEATFLLFFPPLFPLPSPFKCILYKKKTIPLSCGITFRTLL